MSTKTYTEVKGLVKAEIDSIKKRDGVLPPTPYVVMEVSNRLKNLQPWQGYNATVTLSQNLRGIIEEITKGKRNILKVVNPEDKEVEVIWVSPSPYEALGDAIGDFQMVGRSVDSAPISTRKEKLKKRLREAS
jgi:hypothetical protein